MSIRIRRRILAGAVVLAGVPVSILVATPAFAVPGLTVVIATSDIDLGGFKAAEATCPRDTKVLGGGGYVIGGGHSVHVYALIPQDNGAAPDTFWAGGTAHDPTYPISNWTITALAICGSGVTGHRIVEVQGGSAPGGTHASTFARCPEGTKVIGAGGMVFKRPFVLDGIHIDNALTGVTVEGYKTEYFPDGNPGMGVYAYAICVDPLPGQQLVTASSGYSSNDKPTLVVHCPRGTLVHGTGGELTDADGQAYIEALLPFGPVSSVYLTAREDTTGHSSQWKADVYAICAA